MYHKKFCSLRNNQRFALALCLLLFSQQVDGKVESRRRYESPFEDLFQRGKTAGRQFAVVHSITTNGKVLQPNMNKIMDFVKDNPDKIILGVGLVTSSWLLYQSIVLGSTIERFFDEIVELQGQFTSYNLMKSLTLKALYDKAREAVGKLDSAKQKEYFRTVYKELMEYIRDLEIVMDNVDDIIEDVNKAKNDALINAVLSGSIALLAGVAMVMGGPVTVPPEVWNGGAALTMGISGVSAGMSLRNVQDLQKILRGLKTLKQELRQLRKYAMEWMIRLSELM